MRPAFLAPILLVAVVTGCTRKPETLNLTPAQWREDLNFFARELPRRHQNAFHHLSRERFEAEVAALDRRLETLDADAVYVGMSRIANLVGDGHTYLRVPRDRADLPFDVERFGDAYRVTSAVAGQERALGARVLKIEDIPLARAVELAREQTPSDENEPYRDALVPVRLTTGIFLHGLGITRDRSAARYALEDDRGEFVVDVRARQGAATPSIRLPADLPIYRQHSDEPFRVVWLARERTNAIHPDQEIVPTWEEFRAGRDPVLEWVLAFRATG